MESREANNQEPSRIGLMGRVVTGMVIEIGGVLTIADSFNLFGIHRSVSTVQSIGEIFVGMGLIGLGKGILPNAEQYDESLHHDAGQQG